MLVVDREPVVGELISGAVSAQPGYQAVLVADAAVALATIEAVQVDLAIIDLDLPGLSGIELVDRLRSGASRTIPVLVVSDGSAEHTAAMRERRIATFVQKPFEIDTLIGLVRRLVPPGPVGPV